MHLSDPGLTQDGRYCYLIGFSLSEESKTLCVAVLPERGLEARIERYLPESHIVHKGPGSKENDSMERDLLAFWTTVCHRLKAYSGWEVFFTSLASLFP